VANGSADEIPVRLTRVEAFNALIRGMVVLVFTLTIAYGFVVSKVLSTETMVILANTVFIWWFKSRDDEKKTADAKPAPVSGGA
jgi:hypothetical protein